MKATQSLFWGRKLLFTDPEKWLKINFQEIVKKPRNNEFLNKTYLPSKETG